MAQPEHEGKLAEKIDHQVSRKLKARAQTKRSVWVGLGMFGIVGWAIALPTLFGAAIGSWIDKGAESDVSWTLALLIAGLCLGCFNAWMWIRREAEDDE